MPVLLASLALAGLVGFAAHRASFCSVKAVAELISSGGTHMFAGFVKTALWVLALTLPLVWWAPGFENAARGQALTLAALLGGAIFGAGAALNGGCAFATLGRLARGDGAMILTISGFALGGAVGAAMERAGYPAPAPATAFPLAEPGVAGFLAAAALWVWAVFEIARLWRTRPKGGPRAILLAGAYRISTAAALVGAANALLYAMHGSWSYTGLVTLAAAAEIAGAGAPSALRWGLFGVVFAGMLLSAGLSGFRPALRPRLSWLRNLAGGGLMGLGAFLIPGGNDVLILHGMPLLSPHALPAFVSMCASIALMILLMRRQGRAPRVLCTGDVCAEESRL